MIEGIKKFMFQMNTSLGKVQSFKNHPKASIFYQKIKNIGIMLREK